MLPVDASNHAPGPPSVRAPVRAAGLISRLGTPAGLFLPVALLICVFAAISEVRDPDFWWHLRTGQMLLDHHALLGTDPYTYTAGDHRWVMHEWGWEVLVALMWATGHSAVVVAVVATATGGGFAAILARARLRHPSYLAAGTGLCLGAIAGYPIWGPRVQMITFALTCTVLWIAERHLARGGRLVYILPPLFLVWGNLHSGFTLGIGVLVLILGCEWATNRFGLDSATVPGPRLGSLALAVGISALVLFINPNGPSIWLYALGTVGSSAQQALILEWASPNFHMGVLRAFELMLVSLFALAVVGRRVRPTDLALCLAGIVLALESVRNISIFVALTTPTWIDMAGQAHVRASRWWVGRRAAAARSAPAAPAQPRRRALLAATMITSVGVGVLVRFAGAVAPTPDSLFYARTYPVCAARWLDGAPGGLRIFNQYGEGGYLAWRLAAKGDKVYIFGDAALMGDHNLLTYSTVVSLSISWDRTIRAAGTDLVLYDTGTPLATALSEDPAWVQVYSDPRSVAYVPRGSTLRLPPRPHLGADLLDTCAQLQAQGLGESAAASS